MSKSLVIIDDTEDLRDLLSLALGRGGFDVVGEAGDGRAGIELVRQKKPEVILLDLAMPTMDGLEALPQIRRLSPDAKIVVLSGFGAQQMSARAMAAGADGYIQKGVPLNSIIDYVSDVTSNSPNTKHTFQAVPTAASAKKAGPAPKSSPRPSEPSTSSSPAPTAAPILAPPVSSAPGIAAPTAGPVIPVPEENSINEQSAMVAVQQSPYGVLEVADEPLFRLAYANPVAARLLANASPGTPLGSISSEFATLVAFHRLDPEASFEVDLPNGRVRATTRKTSWSILVYLDSTADDVDQLRRAIATAAHEVRGPVSVLTGIAETIGWSAQTIDPEKRDRLLASVGRQARMLDSITADLLTTAQIQRGTLRIDLQDVSVATIVEGAIGDRYEVDVEVNDTRKVRADPLRVEQMLTNLLSNAQKYGAPPFRITVENAEEFVRVDVIDAGEGVPAEFADDLFTEFTRANTAVASGTGLGLYVVRTLARAQGGDVTYRPGTEDEGDGAVFSVTLRAV